VSEKFLNLDPDHRYCTTSVFSLARFASGRRLNLDLTPEAPPRRSKARVRRPAAHPKLLASAPVVRGQRRIRISFASALGCDRLAVLLRQRWRGRATRHLRDHPRADRYSRSESADLEVETLALPSFLMESPATTPKADRPLNLEYEG